jgi:hypothetical protein
VPSSQEDFFVLDHFQDFVDLFLQFRHSKS